MKTKSKVLASFLAAAVWADGEYDEFEQQFTAELAEELGVKSLEKDLNEAISSTANLSEDMLADLLEKEAKNVDREEKEGILMLCLQMMSADAFLGSDEIENYFSFAEILGVDEDAAEAMLDEYIEEEEDLIVE